MITIEQVSPTECLIRIKQEVGEYTVTPVNDGGDIVAKVEGPGIEHSIQIGKNDTFKLTFKKISLPELLLISQDKDYSQFNDDTGPIE